MSKSHEQFIQDRNEALLSLDKEKILSFLENYDDPSARAKEQYPEDEIVFWASVHKARVAIVSFSESEKEISRKWLREHGFRPAVTASMPIHQHAPLAQFKFWK